MKRASLVLILILCLTVPSLLSLYTAHAPSQPPIQLTFNTARDFGPVVSSDGLKIAFFSDVDGDYDIYMVNSDGTGLHPLTVNSNSNDTSPSISSNGSRVAFQSSSGNDADIFVINSDGVGLVRVTGTRPLWNSLDETAPDLSGDGQWVTFVSNDNPLGLNPEGDDEVFLVRTDGADLRQLTVNNSRDDANPSVSSDGGKVAFQRNLGTWEVFIINSDATGLTKLTSNSGSTDPSTSISISADGSKVAFDSRAPATESFHDLMRVGQQPIPSSEVYVVSSNGTGPVQVSATGGDNFTPSISGDGRIVAYVSTGDGDREVYLVNSDGTGLPLRVTENLVFDVDPSIDFDGDRVAFASNFDGDFEIFISHITTASVHDIAVTAITVPRRIGYNTIVASPLKVNVTIANQGTVSEAVSVEISSLSGPILSSQTTTVSPGASKNLTFGIVTQYLAVGSYTLVARAVPVPGEIDTADNVLQDGTIQVRIPGDVDGDRDVDIFDAAALAFNYGGTCATPARYVDAADLDNDCDIDIFDAATLAFYYGTRA